MLGAQIFNATKKRNMRKLVTHRKPVVGLVLRNRYRSAFALPEALGVRGHSEIASTHDYKALLIDLADDVLIYSGHYLNARDPKLCQGSRWGRYVR